MIISVESQNPELTSIFFVLGSVVMLHNICTSGHLYLSQISQQAGMFMNFCMLRVVVTVVGILT